MEEGGGTSSSEIWSKVCGKKPNRRSKSSDITKRNSSKSGGEESFELHGKGKGKFKGRGKISRESNNLISITGTPNEEDDFDDSGRDSNQYRLGIDSGDNSARTCKTGTTVSLIKQSTLLRMNRTPPPSPRRDKLVRSNSKVKENGCPEIRSTTECLSPFAQSLPEGCLFSFSLEECKQKESEDSISKTEVAVTLFNTASVEECVLRNGDSRHHSELRLHAIPPHDSATNTSCSAIVQAIFQALFGAQHPKPTSTDSSGSNSHACSTKCTNASNRPAWDDDSDSDEECIGIDAKSTRIEKVDEKWFASLITNAVTSDASPLVFDGANASTPVAASGNTETGEALISRWIDFKLILSLVSFLSHDDVRIPSPRVIVLKALYRSCKKLRIDLCRAMVIAGSERESRCKRSKLLAESEECALYLAADMHSIQFDSPVCVRHGVVLTGRCGPLGKTYLHRKTSLTRRDGLAGRDMEGKSKEIAGNGIITAHTIQKVKLVGVSVKDSDVFLLELLQYILLFETKNISAYLSSTEKEYDLILIVHNLERVAVSILSCSSTVLSGGGGRGEGSSVDGFGIDGENGASEAQKHILDSLFSALVMLIELENKIGSVCHIPKLLLGTWTKNDDYSTQISYLRASEIILCQSSHVRLSSKSPTTKRLVSRLISCVTSCHFKIALQSIRLLLSAIVLHTYILQVSSRPLSNLFSSSFSSDYNMAPILHESNTYLSYLVDNLRLNRGHWHPLVRAQSDEAFDFLLDCMD